MLNNKRGEELRRKHPHEGGGERKQEKKTERNNTHACENNELTAGDVGITGTVRIVEQREGLPSNGRCSGDADQDPQNGAS